MKRRTVFLTGTLIALALILALGLRGTQTPQSSGLDVGGVKTAAVASFVWSLTQVAEQALANSSTTTPSPTPAVPAASPTPSTITPTPSCFHLRLLRDLTIPDYSHLNPG